MVSDYRGNSRLAFGKGDACRGLVGDLVGVFLFRFLGIVSIGVIGSLVSATVGGSCFYGSSGDHENH